MIKDELINSIVKIITVPAERKEYLINKIKNINDENLLKKIKKQIDKIINYETKILSKILSKNKLLAKKFMQSINTASSKIKLSSIWIKEKYFKKEELKELNELEKKLMEL